MKSDAHFGRREYFSTLARTSAFFLALIALPAAGQVDSTQDKAGQSQKASDSRSPESRLAVDFIKDQRDIWTSPLRLKRKDYKWILPATGFLTVLIDNDVNIYRGVAVSDSRAKSSSTFSDAGVGVLGASAASLYMFGRLRSNDRAREAGILSAESAMNGLAVGYALKWSLRRNRPEVGNFRGDFFQANGDSFPSEHAIVAWSIASTLAREYPGTLTKIGVYGIASGISIARILGKQHFPADVVVGSAIGWSIGRGVYHTRHDPLLDGSDIGSFHKNPVDEPGESHLASTSVSLDSWVYGALERLAAYGFVESQMQGVRPWTRAECARQTGEALDHSESYPEEEQVFGVKSLLDALKREFAPELQSQVESFDLENAYIRYRQISGTPLNDSYHFGQSVTNDFGRPYWTGNNLIAGVSGSAQHGRFAFYLRTEYQHAPAIPAYADSVRAVISQIDQNPIQPAASPSSIDRLELLDAYGSVALANFQLSFGNQTLWWGPNRGGSFLASNNAAPMPMFRISQSKGYQLPGILSYLGLIRTEFFAGKLTGHRFPRGPFINGQKISLKVTPNLEFGFSRTAVFAGDGHPLTLRSFGSSLFSTTSSGGQGGRADPGDRRGGFDFSYRLPGFRNWLTLYSDSIVDDDVSPVSAPRRAGFNPGLYLTHFPIPRLKKLDLRAEFVSTDPPTSRSQGGQFIYWNDVYHDAYTNDGNLIGNPIGREGKGFQLWSTYWVSAFTRFEVSYRNVKLSSDFIPGGGTQNSVSGRADFKLGSGFFATSSVQWEKWSDPVLAMGKPTNIVSSIQVTFQPASKQQKP